MPFTPRNNLVYNSCAGWSSLAARRAHNPKVTGSNPVPATRMPKPLIPKRINGFFLSLVRHQVSHLYAYQSPQTQPQPAWRLLFPPQIGRN